jgi:hypothetical protein
MPVSLPIPHHPTLQFPRDGAAKRLCNMAHHGLFNRHLLLCGLSLPRNYCIRIQSPRLDILPPPSHLHPRRLLQDQR